MAALGHGQGEVEGRSAQTVGRVGGAEVPGLAGGGHQLDAHRRLGQGEPPGLEAVGQRAHAEERHMAQTVGRLPLHPEGVGDVLAVSPGFHEAGRQLGGDAHRRSEPWDASRGVGGPGGGQHGGAGVPPPGQQLGPGQVPVGDRHPVRHAIEVGHGRVEVGYEGRRLDQGYAASVVEIGKVAHLVLDAPAVGRGGERPGTLVERQEQGLERAGLGRQVDRHRLDGRGGHRPCQRGGRFSANDSGPSWASSLM